MAAPFSFGAVEWDDRVFPIEKMLAKAGSIFTMPSANPSPASVSRNSLSDMRTQDAVEAVVHGDDVLLGTSALVAAGRLVGPFDISLKSRWTHGALRLKKIKAFRYWVFAEMPDQSREILP